MSAQFSKILWFELRMPAKWGILQCRHMWHSKFQSWARKPQYFPIFEAKTCHKQFIDWPEIYPKAFQVPSSTPSCMIRIAWGNHFYPSEGFYQNLEYIQKALKAQRNRTLMPKSLALFHSFPRNPSVLFALGTVLYPFLCTSLDSKILKWVVLEWFTALIYIVSAYKYEYIYIYNKSEKAEKQQPGAESLNNRAKTPEMSASKGIQKNKWSMSK